MHLIAVLSFPLLLAITNAASIIRAGNPTCWEDESLFLPATFRDCIDIINNDVAAGYDIDEVLKFSFDPTFRPDVQLPKYWKRPGLGCGVGVDLAPGLQGYDRTTLRDIIVAARAVAVDCVIRPPHTGGFVQIGWHGKLGVLISGRRAPEVLDNGTVSDP
ncbi:MAG: hypothetical protein Q9174_007103, partial [Haloplaca sp. 1 TL-2023]